MNELSRCVVPRVSFFEHAERVPLLDVIDRILYDANHKVVRLDGVDCASSLEYLKNGFADDPRIHVCATPRFAFKAIEPCHLWIHSDPKVASSLTLNIAPWDRDDVIQYLLLCYPERCAAVLSRIGPADYGIVRGGPSVWQCIIEAILSMSHEVIFMGILESILMSKLPRVSTSLTRRESMEWLGDQLLIPDSLNRLMLLSDDPVYHTLLSVPQLRLQIEADRFAKLLQLSNKRILQTPRSSELLTEVSQRLKGSTKVTDFLRRCVYQSYASMAASLLIQIDPSWKPSKGGSYEFQHAYLARARWREVLLDGVKFGNANLSDIDLDESLLTRSFFGSDICDRASFVDARMKGTTANKSSFVDSNFFRAEMLESKWKECDLRFSNFSGANFGGSAFTKCDLSETSFRACVAGSVLFSECKLGGADFTDAQLQGASLQVHDLREAVFCRTNLSKANLHQAILESLRMQRCNLDRALLSEANLSGTAMTECSLQEANLVNARLAEVDWELCDLKGADLRGVTFHYGSTRCGIVNSPYPSHGTRTGFYTDDREDLYFQTPEAIRKASLVGCDLRGANIAGVDFYLVDLRDAILEFEQRKQIAASGGILK